MNSNKNSSVDISHLNKGKLCRLGEVLKHHSSLHIFHGRSVVEIGVEVKFLVDVDCLLSAIQHWVV